jgi:hypothetical protein
VTRKNHIKKLDGIWSDKVRSRDNFACQKCGEYGDSPHHIFPRRYIGTRFILANGITFCYRCHIDFAHGKPEEFKAWIIDKIGSEAYEDLHMQSLILKVDLGEAEIKLMEE